MNLKATSNNNKNLSCYGDGQDHKHQCRWEMMALGLIPRQHAREPVIDSMVACTELLASERQPVVSTSLSWGLSSVSDFPGSL